MSREFKFRAWNSLAEQMEQPAFPNFEPDGDIEVSGYYAKDNSVAVMQYTSVKDKNEHDIYEGDLIMELAGTKPAPSYRMYEVIYEDACFIAHDFSNRKASRLSALDPRRIEVIGNIYENPELITEKDGDGTKT